MKKEQFDESVNRSLYQASRNLEMNETLRYLEKDVKETERAIVSIKDFFQVSLATELNLTRVTAPLFVPAGTGINDDLNGVEKPVSFNVKGMNGQKMEIVQSLAKWKRLKVTELGCKP